MMFDIPRLYISQVALLYAVQPVRLYPIIPISILLYGYVFKYSGGYYTTTPKVFLSYAFIKKAKNFGIW
jgi:hypothetical protein